MENTEKSPSHNKNVEGYKVPGDGNVPNAPAFPGNKSFDENSHKTTHKSPEDIPGKEFNIGDKAYADSSKEDFVKTVSNYKHADKPVSPNGDLRFKKPDGDR